MERAVSADRDIRVHRIAFSTNVERVALGAAHKRLEIAWVDVDPLDRATVRALSGQELVPVLECAGEVVADSAAILRWLEARAPQPALWPGDVADRALADLAVEWFNSAWKLAPNAIDDELGAAAPDGTRIDRWSADMARHLRWFDALLDGRDFLLGDELGVLDVCAFPFLKYGLTAPDAGDRERFHHVLHDHQREAAELPRLAAWIRRIDALPRA